MELVDMVFVQQDIPGVCPPATPHSNFMLQSFLYGTYAFLKTLLQIEITIYWNHYNM